MTDTTTLPSRSEVPLEQTWDLASVFANPTGLGGCLQSADRDVARPYPPTRGTWVKARRCCWNSSSFTRKPAH